MNKEVLQQGKIDHHWGFELNWASNTSYTGKLLVFKSAGDSTELMIHRERRKSWFVNAGKFRVHFVDVKTGHHRDVVIEEGKTVDIGEMTPHKLEALTDDAVVFEVGTPHYGEDDFRLSPVPGQPEEQ